MVVVVSSSACVCALLQVVNLFLSTQIFPVAGLEVFRLTVESSTTLPILLHLVMIVAKVVEKRQGKAESNNIKIEALFLS